MAWKEILKEAAPELLVTVTVGFASWFAGLFKGRKESSRAVERKNEIYQPLIDDLEKYSKFNWSIRETVRTPFLKNIVDNSYKFSLGDELQAKCDYLLDVINEYNKISTQRVAHSIIAKIFEKGYAEIYGSTIEGVVHHSERDGTEWDEEILAEPITLMQRSNFSKEIDSLLINEGNYSGEVCVDEENSFYEPIYLELKRIYELSLNIVINGKRYVHPKPVIKLTMLPEEYMALQFDFFAEYNSDDRIKKKYELREEIIYTSQAIVQLLKERIEKIIQVYEVEEI